MSLFHLFTAPDIFADIPPPPYSTRQHSAAGWAYFLLFWAVCMAAGVGLRTLFRRRAKKTLPRPETVTKE